MRLRFSIGHDQPFVFPILLIFVSLFSGCRRQSEELPLIPPTTPPLTREYIGFAVVNVSFTHLLDKPGGVSQGYLRRGTVVRIIERSIDRTNSESWIFAEGNYQTNSNTPGSTAVTRGWLQESTVDIFDNESQANTASKALTL